MKPAEALSTAGYLAAWRVVRMLPEPAAHAVFARIADRVYAGNGKSVRRLRGNLARVVPDDRLEETVRAGVRSYLRYWCESFRLPSWPIDDVVARIELVHEDKLTSALDAGRGVVLALPHMGNWDWAGAWACATHTPLMTVAERLKPERLYDEFVAYRERLGMVVLPLTGGQPPMERLADYVRDGGLVCLLGDRDLSRSSVRVDLLGEPARLPVGPAVLAERTGAPLLAATLHYDGDRMITEIHDGFQGTVAERTQQIADVFSAGIRAHPQDWHMMQRVFEADL